MFDTNFFQDRFSSSERVPGTGGGTGVAQSMLRDVLIVGAGPAGLACALEFQINQQDTVVIEKGCLTNSIYGFPDQMRFFSDAASLQFEGMAMVTESEFPSRTEAIRYYRDVVATHRLDVRQREAVLSIDGGGGEFYVCTTRGTHRARRVILATGFYGAPNLLGIPGESLPKVAHYYRDAHPYFGCDVAVVGGRNSAGIVACELAEAGARVTLIHRRDSFGMKPRIRRELDDKIARSEIAVFTNSRVLSIHDSFVAIGTPEGRREVPNEFVFAMTGYRPDFEFLRRNGIPLAPCGTRPLCDPETLESGRPGIYFAGTVIAGIHTHEIAIDSARHHGARILAAIRASAPLELRGDSQNAQPLRDRSTERSLP